VDEVKPAARLPTVEHREPCESRGSRTVLGAPGVKFLRATRPSRHFTATHHFGRFRGEADIEPDLKYQP
jgi:hypothetical protein